MGSDCRTQCEHECECEWIMNAKVKLIKVIRNTVPGIVCCFCPFYNYPHARTFPIFTANTNQKNLNGKFAAIPVAARGNHVPEPSQQYVMWPTFGGCLMTSELLVGWIVVIRTYGKHVDMLKFTNGGVQGKL